ncbi:acetyltransferase [Actinobacillus equuli subsp. haemolyticus]|uniref:acetyltransferase n=1 Tax=Actinobacillus equuli TaxID=718 RepID=UPI002441E2EB|nr:acetyltransferase [Actinobacillus equuli]WGE63017.1 acetyltransferase [Actinobacillus equuli subsp. haemolyticus]WGE67226.1 acetyltransferase [Actinobacillus equuli subsp. haemolyticus]
MKKKIIFIGAGGYAKSALDSLDKEQYEFCGFIDNLKPIGSTHLGYPILAKTIQSFAHRSEYCYFISIGGNESRTKKFILLQELNCEVINIIDKSAIVSEKSKLGIGIFIGKLSIVNAGTKIGNNVIINTKSLIEHGCCIEDHCNISTNATLNGDVFVSKHSFVGSSSVINGQLHIGRGAIIGSGSVVIRNVDPETVVAGVPAKFIRKLNE